jgi:hypothetical protein
MNITDHYYFLLLTAFSSRLGDVFFMILSAFWNLLLWEIRSYSSIHMNNKIECERLLTKINKSYWFSTNYRTFINKELSPTGFIIGKTGYIAFLSYQSVERGEEQEIYKITLYGWWSIRQLITKDVECSVEPGEYRIIRCLSPNHYLKTTDNYHKNHYHSNCYKATDMILDIYNREKRGVFFIYGDPGLGKTTTARMISKELNATLCPDFEEFTYFYESFITSFDLLYNYVQPNESSPFVVTIDELEQFLLCEKRPLYDSDDDCPNAKESFKKKHILKNKNIKKRWVRLMDTIQERKYVIFIFTSNKSKSFFDEIDPALLREYRVTEVLHYTDRDIYREPFVKDTLPLKKTNKRKKNV